jgi:hypothetical protein
VIVNIVQSVTKKHWKSTGCRRIVYINKSVTNITVNLTPCLKRGENNHIMCTLISWTFKLTSLNFRENMKEKIWYKLNLTLEIWYKFNPRNIIQIEFNPRKLFLKESCYWEEWAKPLATEGKRSPRGTTNF